MSRYYSRIASALAATLTVIVGHTQSSRGPEEAVPPIEIVGVKPGMTPDEVRNVLRARKFPMHEFVSTLAYLNSRTRQSARLRDSRFLNAIVQSAPSSKNEESDTLTVFFSPIPGHERALAIAHYTGYPHGKEIPESDMKARLAAQYGEFSGESARPKTGFQFAHLWNLPAAAKKADRNCNFNLTQRFAKAGWWNSAGAAPQNYVLANWDLLLNLIKDDCGPNLVEVDWSTRDAGLPPEQRVVTEYSVSTVSLPLTDEGLMTAAKLAQDLADVADGSLAHHSSGGREPDL